MLVCCLFSGMFLRTPQLEPLIIDENDILARSLFGVTFSSAIISMRASSKFSAILFSCLAVQLWLGFVIFLLQAFQVSVRHWIGMTLHVVILVCTPLAFMQVYIIFTPRMFQIRKLTYFPFFLIDVVF